LLSLGVELLQAYIPERVSSYWDLVCNIGGAMLGVLGAIAWRAFSSRLATETSSADSVALLGAIAWIAWRWSPFDLHIGLAAFKSALQPLSDLHLAFGTSLQFLVWWLIVSEQVFAWVHRARATESLLGVMAVTLAGRFFFVASPLVPAELLAIVLVLPVLVVLHRVQPALRNVLLIVAFASNAIWLSLMEASLLAETHGKGFDWWPFIDWMQQGMPIDSAWLTEQLFILLSIAWLLRRIGLSPRAVTYWATGAAIAMECIKTIFLSMGSVTLPVFALAITVTLSIVYKRPAIRKLF
jgi:hypothetical protein